MGRLRNSVLSIALAIAPACATGASVSPAFAQAIPALTQSFDYSGQWAIDYPAAWVLNLAGFPILASIPSAVTTLLMNDPLPVGSMAIGIIPPETNAMLGLTPGMPLDEVARRVAAIYAVTEPVTVPFETTAGPALSVGLETSPRLPLGTTILVVDRAGTTFVFLVVVGDFTGATPLLRAMLETVR